ncbi:MAG: response regulator [Novosphingobium sp.]|nr:response regulator [Novosphingobium sp.]
MNTKVLIVEDEILVALELEDLLTDAGHVVVGVVPDRASLNGIGEGPQIALVDINLRDGRSGPAIADALASGYGTKIVYVTANPDQIGKPAPTAIGFVPKPFSQRDILAAIEFALQGNNSRRPAALRAFAN